MAGSRSDRLASLDRIVLDGAEAIDADRVLELAEDLTSAGEPIEALVARYGDCDAPEVLRVLSFLLARGASRRPDKDGLARAVWQLARNDHLDDSATINLLSAIQLLAAYDALGGEAGEAGEPPDPALASLLLRALERPAAVQATALPVIGVLHARGVLARLAPDALAGLRERLPAVARDDELVSMEWPMVEPFLADPA